MCQQGHAIDKEYDDIYYVPENSKFSMITQSVTFNIKGKEQKLNLKPRITYILPSGYKIEVSRCVWIARWYLLARRPRTFCALPSRLQALRLLHVHAGAHAMHLGTCIDDPKYDHGYQHPVRP